jgi:hypothetical protein
MENFPKTIMTIQIIMLVASLMIFQTYKNVVIKNVHSLEWFFWLYFYPFMDDYDEI